jgi:anti-sigma factor ChrR (cupin superfamily)
MELRSDFTKREIVRAGDEAFRASPMQGVERLMLDRIGEEVARATTIVRYAPNSKFSTHTHGGGEEFLVLEGTFYDEHGAYPAGTYVRNPIGTSHAPWAGPDGALLFVKLHQFEAEDQERVAIDTKTADWHQGAIDGLAVLPLFERGSERIALVKWAPQTQFMRHSHWGGEKILVLDGVFGDEHGSYPRGTWMRNPHLSEHKPFTGSAGAVIYVKTGHLAI